MLTITYLSNGNILLNSDRIQALITTPSDYLQVKIDATINCCTTIYTTTKTMPLQTNPYISFTSDGIEVTPTLFNVVSPATVIDGVYHFNVKIFTDSNHYSYEESCAFIDITYKCKVAAYIDLLNDTSEDGQIATNVHILHYALTNGSNCGCNCVEMCNVFSQLAKLLAPITPQIQGCGC